MTDQQIFDAMQFVRAQFKDYRADVVLCAQIRDALRPLVPGCLIDVVLRPGMVVIEVRRQGEVKVHRVEAVVCV